MVFGVGLAKTGTSSLNRALQILGLRSIHYPDPATMLSGRFEQALEGYDAATDITVSAFFPELDRRYPGSRFILTVREADAWIDSIGLHIRRLQQEELTPEHPKGRVREIIFGTVGWDETLFRRALARHTRNVEDYFAHRPRDLLIVDLCSGPEWAPLCTFLNRPIPSVPFPHENKRPVITGQVPRITVPDQRPRPVATN